MIVATTCSRSANRVRSRCPEWIAAVVEQPPFRFVQLDSQIAPGQVGGEVGDEQLAWLERLLQSALTLRTILFVHHPGESSSEGCRDFKTLLDIAERHNCVQTIVTGHDHAFALRRIGSLHQVALPATAFPFDPGTDCGWIEATLSEEGLDLALRGASVDSRHHLAWR